MSGSHFGSGYWVDDYFGLYWQPEAGGSIIGTLSGSFAGTSTFSGALDAPAAAVADSGAHGTKRRARDLQRFLDDLRPEPPKPVPAPRPKPEPVAAKVIALPVAAVKAPEWDEEEELILMLLAA